MGRRAKRIPYRKMIRVVAIIAVMSIATIVRAHGSIALLMEEPYGEFGAFNPTGHAAIYLNHVCAASPTELRVCQPGEFGVVISRYHKIDGYDWIAIPIIPYLYAVDDASEAPLSVNKEQVAALRDAYRRAHLEALAPDGRGAKIPGGEWTQLVGSSYDRTIHGFEVSSTTEQDQRFMALFSDRKNDAHFNLFFRNCADFSRSVLDIYLPHAVHRNFVADAGLTTPKQVARSLVKYGKEHPEVEMSAFIIPQVPGTVKRSHPVDGVAESLVKSKKYLLPMAVLAPELTGGVVVAYLADGRLKLPKNAVVFNVDDEEAEPVEAAPLPGTPEKSAGSDSDATPAGSSTPPQADPPAPVPSPPPASAPTLL